MMNLVESKDELDINKCSSNLGISSSGMYPSFTFLAFLQVPSGRWVAGRNNSPVDFK